MFEIALQRSADPAVHDAAARDGFVAAHIFTSRNYSCRIHVAFSTLHHRSDREHTDK
jgi:hypothetical protein